MERENKIIAIGAFATGVIVGRNWNKIKKFGGIAVKKTIKMVSGVCKSSRELLAVQKEHVQDLLAEAKAKKEKTKRQENERY